MKSPKPSRQLRLKPTVRRTPGRRPKSAPLGTRALIFPDVGGIPLRKLLDDLKLLVVWIDGKGAVKYVNPYLLELTGFTREEVVGKNWVRNFVPPRDRKSVSRVMTRTVKTDSRTPSRSSVLTKKGTERLVAWNNSMLQDQTGKPAGVLGVGEDIGERERLEPALAESQEKLKGILETVTNGIYMVDEQGHMTFANEGAEKTVGATREQLEHLRYDDPAWKITTVGGEPFPNDEQPYVRVMETGRPVYGVEQSVVRPDGTRIIVSINAAPLHNAAGKVIGEVGVLTDITRQSAAEDALARERRLFNALMSNSLDTIYFKDIDSRFTRINEAQAQVLGVRDPAGALGKTDLDFFEPEHAREAFADEQGIIETGTPIVGKLERIRHADGVYRWVTSTKAPLRDEAGRMIGTFGISRDVDEEKRLEDQLEQVKDYLETLIESANDIVFTLDPGGHFTFANRRATQITGYAPSQWLGKHFLGILAPEDRVLAAGRVKALALDQPQSLHFRLVNAGGELVDLAVNTTPILEHGKTVGTLCIARDMTETNRLEQTIREERDRLDAILRSMAEGVLVTDANHQLILINRAAEDLIGIPRQQLLAKDLDSVTLPITRADLDRQLAQTASPEGLYSRARAWGTRMLDVAMATWHDAQGNAAGTVSLVRDVTELLRVDQMKNEFISLVSHELRTPLTSVKGYTDLILSGDAGAVNPEQQEFLGIVKSNVDHLIMMINDLLDISRIEAGRIKLLPGPVELTPLIGEIIRSMRPQWEQKSQIVSADLPKLLPLLFADRDRLSQILGNLLSNSHKYSPPGTRIRIHVERVDGTRLTATDPDLIFRRAKLLAISVEDEGIGISEADQAKLFTKFYRVDNSLTREIGGTGLGLAIIKSFVELHGGRVWVASPLDMVTGRGSRFTFTVPILEQTGLDMDE